MGYMVNTREVDFVLPASGLQAAYEAMCALNHNPNVIKQGGSWSGGKMQQEWFSWVSPTYDEECKTAAEILEHVGFGVSIDEATGGLSIEYYSDKSGQEELFIEAIAPYALEGSYIVWDGESGDIC